jgi:hypothetical protein
LAITATSEDAPKRLRVLIVTGNDVGAHDWRSTTPVTRAILEETKRFEVFVSEEPSVLETGALMKYDLLLLNYRNAPEEKLGEAAQKNIISFLKSGKGLVAVHFVVNAWGDWPEFSNIIGRIWVGRRAGQGEKVSGHGPRGTFKVRVTAKENPIVQGLADFEADDELYARLAGDAPIESLAMAYSADYSQKDEPMAWTLRYGEGRVFATVLGHDARARENPAFKKLLAQGSEWAAAGKVAR